MLTFGLSIHELCITGGFYFSHSELVKIIFINIAVVFYIIICSHCWLYRHSLNVINLPRRVLTRGSCLGSQTPSPRSPASSPRSSSQR